MNLFDRSTFECSKLVTKRYSTSFSLGISMLAKKYHQPIYAVYGFVRYADEIVDTFHGYDKEQLLEEFELETYKAIQQKICLNPILNSFQIVVNTYQIDHHLIDAFFKSMKMDLKPQDYDRQLFEEYIYGSAEVVGLMCLQIFCAGDQKLYNDLLLPAKKLGAAFQKVNFLRDIRSDFGERGRIYFPGLEMEHFDDELKRQIEKDIKADFDDALKGILKLPKGASIGVYLAYVYYLKLFAKIRSCPVSQIMQRRIRIPDVVKLSLLAKTYFRYKFAIFGLQTSEI
ncbi:MAG: squalene/phytoene synthase family protein [Cyclobacteriaceae bacterium]|nr:squalene/phytoene synthase family protein [Cyclobacteriaceae bacterium]